MSRLLTIILTITSWAMLCIPSAWAVDCPHAPPSAECPNGDNLFVNVCGACHLDHSAYGSMLRASGVENVCRSCHIDGGPAPEVNTHASVTQGCGDDCDFTYMTICTDCHNGHKHDQPYDPDGDGSPNMFIAASIRLPASLGGGREAITLDSWAGFNADGNPANGLGMCEVCHTLTADPGTGGARFRRSGDESAHQMGGDCVGCHDHRDTSNGYGFRPQGSGCVGCHDQPRSGRRQITDSSGGDGEFGVGFTSHHVSDGSGGEVATDWDCVVCHAEGDALTAQPDPTYHQVDGVQLRDVDTGSVFPDWSTLAASQRSLFCLSCHDSNGATIIQARADADPEAVTTPLNPFGDGVTNGHEPGGLDGTPAPHSRGTVVDVSAQFAPLNAAQHGVLASAYGAPAPFSSAVDNAIGGVRTDLAWDSTLDCEDCHYGSATNKLSGHGTRNARYMLRDKNGDDNLGSSGTVVCYRCHTPSDLVSVYPEHDNSSHINDSLNLFGISCLNCHGGGTFGGIHGTDAAMVDDDGGGNTTPNVFVTGASLDLVSNWSSWANRGVTCSTASSPTLMSSCTQHGSKSWTRSSGATRTYRSP